MCVTNYQSTEKMAIANPHDRFFKSVFSDKEVAVGFIREFLPEEITSELDLDTIDLEGNTYISKNLEEHVSDLVYRCKFKKKIDDPKNEEQSKQEVWISFLLEHKSFPVYFVFAQLLEYILGIWKRLIKQGEPLVLVLPIVVYHGEDKWKRRQLEEYFYLPNKHFSKYLPIFDYELTDLSKLSDERILNIRQTAKLLNAVMALKHGRDLTYVSANLRLILTGADKYLKTQVGKNFFHTIFVYLLITNDSQKGDFLKSVQQLQPFIKENVMTLYEQLIQEGKIEGREEGREEGTQETKRQATIRLIQKGVANDFIIEVLEVTDEFVQAIRVELDN